MRDQGRLVEWFDEKGYGFIQPNDGDKDRVFLHIKDFSRQGPRPILGCALDYEVLLDERGRFRASQVVYLKANQTQPRQKQAPRDAKSATALQPMQVGIAVYFIALAVLMVMGLLSGWMLTLVLIMNVFSYWFYAQDKEAARAGNRRVPENTLHIFAFLGGWPTAWFAQQKLRHKTQKQPFRKIYFCTIFLNILLILWLISPLNVFHI
jgi:uncharacterized membrane protein YsdA (DUF1294 family)/cold shock CspA family protein